MNIPYIEEAVLDGTDFDLPRPAVEGPDLVGHYISLYWPPDRRYYGARILRWDEKLGTHDVLYHGAGQEVFTEHRVDLSTRSWSVADDPNEGSILGRIVVIDPNDDDTVEEARMKTAYILGRVHPPHREAGQLGRLSTGRRVPLRHRVLWIYGDKCFDDVDLEEYPYMILH